MPANMGVARRLEAANRRIDAAVAALTPDRTPPAAVRNRSFAEVVRAEWLADTLEALAGTGTGQAAGDDLDGMKRADLNALATSLGIADADKLRSKDDVIAAIRSVQDGEAPADAPNAESDPA